MSSRGACFSESNIKEAAAIQETHWSWLLMQFKLEDCLVYVWSFAGLVRRFGVFVLAFLC